jgi:2-oxoglutarate ferredoxin oxidoreductase subunit beta
MNKLFRSYIRESMLPTLFCPGCGNGIVQIAAIHAIERLGVRTNTACVSGIGCSSWIPCYLDMDVIHSMHGRALPVAQGLKLSAPDKNILVFTGDGDALAIGGNHFIHACSRNIDLTVVMVNNYIYGMTGGQKSPSTPREATTKTSPFGSWDEPIDGCKLAVAMGASYVARWTTAHPFDLAKSIADGMAHKGFAFIDVLAQCPVQAGSGVFGSRDPVTIMNFFRERTSRTNTADGGGGTAGGDGIAGSGEAAQGDGISSGGEKIRIGVLHRDTARPDYETRVAMRLAQSRTAGERNAD